MKTLALRANQRTHAKKARAGRGCKGGKTEPLTCVQNPQSPPMHRRQFLALTPPLLLGSCKAPAAAAAVATKTPRKVALIGTGWYGKMDLFRLLQVADVAVVGLCDPDRHQLEKAEQRLRARHPGQAPRLYADHRELLRKETPELVLIETPDHWHALQAIDCLKAGCQGRCAGM